MILDFLLPAPCVVCGSLPRPLCGQCTPTSAVEIDLRQNPALISAGHLEGSLETIVTNYKDKQRIALEKFLVIQLERAVAAAIKSFMFDCFVIPPRNQNNFRKRGFHPIERLVVRTSLAKFRRLSVRLNRSTYDQRNLSSPERKANVSGAFSIPSGEGRVLLVDDVRTTGATLGELARATREAGYEVAGSCVIAKR